MVIRGTPSKIEDYFITDGIIAFQLQQKGFKPVYIDNEALYFKKNKKLVQFLKQLGVAVEFN